ncbi:uncharacterized protein N7500_005613 [Penicillium coprophilum]|uniref:uncharacterized protein n=1 Tax=Penicillium coprophilum TaxID=36646 RepID=UPI0023A175D2|nr:uncharacterized protein N7500_005613 [Penicillium coprophilum]KAJ5163783.1 hypothetical protein N7500_005613 [Penicillium coprophilum]
MLGATGLFNRPISEPDRGLAGRIIPWTLAGLLVAGDEAAHSFADSSRLPGSKSTGLDGMYTMAYFD